MKKIILSVLLLAITATSSMATHLMGGEITLIDLGNKNYLVTLIAYRDTVGIPMATMATFEFTGPNNTTFSTSTPYDSIISGNLLPSYPYGTEIYLFVDTVILPTPGQWTVTWSNCCRNGAIQNLSNPLSESMWLTSSVVVDSVAQNSTPYFLVPAAIYLPVNTSWQYNPLPYDLDGDSLHWSIDQPLSNASTACAGYTTPSSDPTNVFSIDPVTGTISWTANQLGNFVASILVEQYRNGVWMGEIRRDMQFIVVNPGQGAPLWNNLSSLPTNNQGHFSFDLVAGQSFNLDMTASHTDSTRQVFLSAFSEVFALPNSNATFVQTKSSQARGTFSWQPTTADIRTKPYTVVFRVSDGFFTDDKSILMNVNTAVGLQEADDRATLSLYPNPASDVVFISFTHEVSQKLLLNVTAINGQRIITNQEIQAQAGTTLYPLDATHWKPGIYLISLSGNEGAPIQQMLVIE